MKLLTPEFSTQKELFDYLVQNKAEITTLKKTEFKKCDPMSESTFKGVIKGAAFANKGEDTDSDLYRTIVGNTYYYLDSHDDVHVENCFADSIKQRTASKISHLHDHIHQLMAKVGKFSDVYEKQIDWADLGVDAEGSTTILAADSNIKRALNNNIFEAYKSGEIDQHSVGMQYVTIELAINDREYSKEFATWNKYFYQLGNKDDALELGYFWAVKEAKLIEISCVLQGSNPITPTLGPSKDSQKTDPSADSQVKSFAYLNYL